MSDELIGKIRDWLNHQGFSLEMRTARAFREAGFDVSQFEHYIDQETRGVRQIDVIASFSENIDDTNVQVKLIIECKYIENLPWVVLITPDNLDKYSFFSRFLKGNFPSNWKNINTIEGRIIGKVIESLKQTNESFSTFRIDKAGYTVKQLNFKDNSSKDYAYEATVQVNKCVESYDEETKNEYQKITVKLDELPPSDPNLSSYEGNLLDSFPITIAFPFIVVFGHLFEGYLSSSNDLIVNEVNKSVVLVPYRQLEKQPDARIVLSPITIITQGHLDEYVKELKDDIKKLLSQTDAIRDVITHERSFHTPKSSEINIFGYKEKKREF